MRMVSIRLLSLTAIIAAAGILVGQAAPSTAPSTAPAAPPSELKISMMDGSVVGGKLSVPELAVETKFGTLKVPVDQIRSFTPGIKSHPEFEQRIHSLVNDLAADGFADREKAQQALLKLGPEIKGELERQLKTAEAEKQLRLQKILEEFEEIRDDDEPDTSQGWVRDDVIATQGFTIVGHITTSSFSVTSPYGTLQLQLADIRGARRDAPEPEEIRKSLAITGIAIAQRSFTKGVRLNKGDIVSITATGTIQMTPWGNIQVGPDGGGNFGMIQPGNIPGGALVARMSSGGDLFKVGSKYTYTAAKAGVIEFGIAVPGDYSSSQFPGEFQVKIKVVRKPS